MIKANALGETAKKIIAGYLSLAPSLTAFGNTVPISYLGSAEKCFPISCKA
jgi:glutamine synthetase